MNMNLSEREQQLVEALMAAGYELQFEGNLGVKAPARVRVFRGWSNQISEQEAPTLAEALALVSQRLLT
jgi:hypothetical protein